MEKTAEETPPPAAANGADAPAEAEAETKPEPETEEPELHRPDDPGPRSPEDNKKGQGKAWYQTMFSR